jgi:hypothetical protein
MGITIEACSCLKKSNEEQTEFKPKISQNNQKSTTENSISNKTSCVLSLKFPENKPFSFSNLKGQSNTKRKPELTIQAIARAYLFRKKFYKEHGLKEQLTIISNQNIKKNEKEYISDNLLETDKLIKKDFNDDFLLKLEAKDKKEKTSKFNVKTDCLLTKDSNNEDCLYKGELSLDGKFNGYGELYYKNGKKLEGKFENGKLNGYGRLINLFGINCYEGYFKDNQLLDGKGKIIKIEDNGDKIIYEGDIKNMKKEGKGIEKNKNYTYLGSFKDDLRHGKGKIIFNEGEEYYEGEFTNGKMTGYGFYKWSNNNTYKGQFLDGNLHGKGIFKWNDGNEYEGDYVNNIKEGQGEYRCKNGKKYKGPYKNGKQHGIGILTTPNGESFEVEYNDGKVVKKDLVKEKRSFSLKD